MRNFNPIITRMFCVNLWDLKDKKYLCKSVKSVGLKNNNLRDFQKNNLWDAEFVKDSD